MFVAFIIMSLMNEYYFCAKNTQIDYNLYGMGYIHVSKIKFRHPVPEVFSRRKSATGPRGEVADQPPGSAGSNKVKFCFQFDALESIILSY